MTSVTDNDGGIRDAALDQITTGIRDFVKKQEEAHGSMTKTTLDRIDKLVVDLSHASTFFLSKIDQIKPQIIITNLMDGIDDEALQLDYFLYSPFHEAVMDIRVTLGVPDLISTGPEMYEGIKAALSVSVEARNVFMRRGAPPDSPRPDEGYVTKEVVELILKHPHREADIIIYMNDRKVFSTEIDVEYLTMFLEEQRPLSGGVL
jgi:hypothetical protein